jgi:PQQ-dependent dehydrogenase (s-GDH family)
MKRSVTIVFLAAGLAVIALGQSATGPESFTMRVVATGFASPWEIAWGPDGYLWVTERTGYRITRVNPANGAKTVAVSIPEVQASVTQDGLLGMALHPGLLGPAGNNYVYVAFTYDDAPGTRVDRRLAIRRYTYNAGSGTLGAPLDVLTGLSAGDDHVAGRLAFGPDQKLYLSIGDLGNNAGDNRCIPDRSQELPTASDIARRDWTKYQSKILRINLDGSIPIDNPRIDAVRSHIFSYAHRNAQGLAFGRDGKLYSSEHGPGTDDEVNLIEAGKNYGWPHVAGYRDDQSYLYATYSRSRPEPCRSLPATNENDINAVPASVPLQKESTWSHPDFREPMKTFYTVPEGYNWQVSGNATIAPSSIDVYSAADGIPGWASSLLVPSLTKGRVYRLKLSADGRSADGEALEYFRTVNRYRDIAIAPDNRTFYVITDVQGRTTDNAGANTQVLANPGAILEFKYAN